MNTIHLDVSELEPPEPYRMAVELLAALPHESILNMVHRKEPYPLYQTAAEMGFDHKTIHLPDGIVKILFWHKNNSQAAQLYS
ncbi:DUF2249 domain-containing protein [Alkalimarinus coralli]|uniref:DUF2249 domain-containing protein n=1 Tax=Alkalimarinus coralli TaxID=2935863 RepID=UPI00202B4702|nr:DUF2249 domain-containing protein [Alkalimarinus coralli]